MTFFVVFSSDDHVLFIWFAPFRHISANCFTLSVWLRFNRPGDKLINALYFPSANSQIVDRLNCFYFFLRFVYVCVYSVSVRARPLTSIYLIRWWSGKLYISKPLTIWMREGNMREKKLATMANCGLRTIEKKKCKLMAYLCLRWWNWEFHRFRNSISNNLHNISGVYSEQIFVTRINTPTENIYRSI